MHSSWSERLWVGMETEKRTQTKGEEGKRVECPSSWVRMKGILPSKGERERGRIQCGAEGCTLHTGFK
jgi:hypothetical protein